MARKLLIVQAAALDREVPGPLRFARARSVLPAVTCTVQASLRTATPPARHGMVANGLYDRRLQRPMFWEQSARLVEGPRIWDAFRQRGRRVAMLFWQQSLGESVDWVLTPKPVHKHHGGMIQDCYSQPEDLYAHLTQAVGRPFNLMRYWGPLARPGVGDWIADATAAVLADPDAPELVLTYLPTLDYDLQRHGPQHAKSDRAREALAGQLTTLLDAAERHGYAVVVFGDYAIGPVGQADHPNRALREAGLFRTRSIRGRLYPDFPASRAFAMVDHEIAHVYAADAVDEARTVLARLEGVGEVLGRADLERAGLDHANSGELVLIARPGWWLAYDWWTRRREAPDYAGHVDIHNKPGYDPCELFFGWPPPSVSQNAGRVRGSHGRLDASRDVVWASTVELPGAVGSLVDLAAVLREWLDHA